MKKLSKLVSLMLSVVLCIGMASPAFAVEYNVADGAVYVENDDDENGVYSYQSKAEGNTERVYTSGDKDIIITGSYKAPWGKPTGSRITVGENVNDTTITLRNVSIDTSLTGYDPMGTSQAGMAALSITGKQSDVTIKLEGENTLSSGYYRAGLELIDSASVTIDGAGSLTAEGNTSSAGIGSGSGGTAGDITISGSGTVNATGGHYGAGIGSGNNGTAGDITISGSGTVTATSDYGGAGIGSGYSNPGSKSTAGNITISSSGTVNATGSEYGGAGIGSGSSQNLNSSVSSESSVGNITISGSGTVNATGGSYGAGIGSGESSYYGSTLAGNITICSSGTVNATGGYDGAGIGSGRAGSVTGGFGSSSSSVGNITICGSGAVTANGGENGAGIGSGRSSRYTYIDKSGNVTADNSGSSSVGNITICGAANVTATGGKGSEADIGAGKGSEYGKVGTIINRAEEGHEYQVETKPASCTEDGVRTYTCSICGHSYTETIDALGHSDYQLTESKEAACEEEGYKIYTCIRGDDSYKETIPAKGHGEGVWTVTTPAQPGIPGVETLVCPDCGESLGQTRPIPALPVPAIPDDGADTTPDAGTIADQAVPLAGLMPLHELLEALRVHEEIEEIELPEDFKWLDHEHAQAIYWALQEELVVDTEEEPLDPDEALTVGRMRKVLVNFVEIYKGLEDFVVVVEGEDDEIVFDLGERLTAFYGDLEAYLKAQKTKAA